MHILPVLDLMHGRVVRARAGQRHEYRPIESQLASSSEPVAVAAGFAWHFGLRELYVADLDAIAGAEPAREIYAQLRSNGVQLWVDAGIRSLEQARQIELAGVERVVVGLETIAGPEVLALAVKALGERVVFSLDLRQGQPLGNVAAWPAPDAEGIAAHAVASGIRRLVVLDLARVGVATGTGTDALCTRLARAYPQVAVYAGGGVRSAADLRQLRDGGIRGALVASALHDGMLRRQDLLELEATTTCEGLGQ